MQSVVTPLIRDMALEKFRDMFGGRVRTVTTGGTHHPTSPMRDLVYVVLYDSS